MKYNFKKIEKYWQNVWAKQKLYEASNESKKPKYYPLVEFPYPSGDGLHVGHIRSYTAMDVIARKRRMEGHNVMYPIGWDAFGLPTENYAIKTGIHPATVTKKNTDNFRKQLKSLGFSFDWSREINTADPKYYKWTQWLFLQFFKHKLAYKAAVPINWCPKDKIGLANEEVVGGKCERCGTAVEKRNKEQWMLKITRYAEKLLEGLKVVDFLPQIKLQQENWIGKSEGATLKFQISNLKFQILVFTTRPDTLFGATYLVLAPENPLVTALEPEIKNFKEVVSYIHKARKKMEDERLENKAKTGVELKGVKAINPATKKEIPIWMADYVLANYGTGAIMAVPAHDERDFEFAKKYKLRVEKVIEGGEGNAVYAGNGALIHSGKFSGMDSEKAKWEIVKFVKGERAVTYKLHDWVFSRQRYWGEPIPIVNCPKCGHVPVPEKNLPVKLPNVKNYKPRDDGKSPLASIDSWVKTKCPKCKGPAERETDVMPNWAGSSWYYLRYTDPHNSKEFASKKKLEYWMGARPALLGKKILQKGGVNWYNGGMEHVTLHLLYSRFWNLFLHDIGLVPVPEPYKKRTAHGLILGEGGIKMSKSKGNVVNPDVIVKEFGADALRLYEMFLGPFDQAIAWDNYGMQGIERFLNRLWVLCHRGGFTMEGWKTREFLVNRAVQKVTSDIENMHFNTAISYLMVFLKEEGGLLEKYPNRRSIETFLKLLAPFAPHITEELWYKLGHRTSIHIEPWPTYDSNLPAGKTFTLVIQINGKVRHTMEAPNGMSEDEAKNLALQIEKVQQFLGGKEPKKVIYVKGRLINFVI